jgi:hypothetical protein
MSSTALASPPREGAIAVKNQGNVAFKEGRWSDAVALFSTAIDLDPSDATFFANRSAARVNLSQFADALVDARSPLI